MTLLLSCLLFKRNSEIEKSPCPYWGLQLAEHHTADTGRSRRFLKQLRDKILVQVLKELTRKPAILDLLFVNREGLVDDVVIGGHLGYSDHEVVK